MGKVVKRGGGTGVKAIKTRNLAIMMVEVRKSEEEVNIVFGGLKRAKGETLVNQPLPVFCV